MDGEHLHGGCALALLGIKGLAPLPAAEQDKLTIGEIGVGAMREIVQRRAGSG